MVNKLKYIFLSLVRNKISFLLLVIQFTSSFILLNMAIDTNSYFKQENQKIENLFVKNDIYGLIDDIEKGARKEFNNKELNSLYNYIKNLENVQFVSFHPTQSRIYGSKLINEDTTDSHGSSEILVDGKVAEANFLDVIKFDDSILDYMEFNIIQGQFFEKGKMYIDDYVPIVLGNNFKGIHNIGDILYAENTSSFNEKLNLNNSIKLKVIGILEANTEIPLITIRDSGAFKNIDNSIMLPYFTDQAIGVENIAENYNMETEDSIISGALLIKKDVSIKTILQELNQSQDFINFDLLDVRERFDTKITILKMQERAYASLAGILIIFSTIGTIMILLSIIKKSLKEYSIHLLSGASIGDISKIILGQILFIVIFSTFLTLISINTISMYSTKIIYEFNLINLLIAFIIILISWIIPKRYIENIGIIKIIKGEY